MTPEKKHVVRDVVTETQKYFERFCAFPDKGYAFAAALFATFTHCWTEFDTVPYLCVTSYTKGSGKTLLMELISFSGANSFNTSNMSPAAMWDLITKEGPTIYVDQAEYLSGKAIDSSDIGRALTSGYRRGSFVIRKKGNETVKYKVFGPKCFVLIGDVSDVLRDRSIIITMRKEGSGKYERSSVTQRENVGAEIREQISEVVNENLLSIQQARDNFKGLDWLVNARDEEIWTPLFCVAQVFCPHRLDELKRVAADIATEKTQDMRGFIELRKTEGEKQEQREYAERLLQDMISVLGNRKGIGSAELVDALKAIDVAPWRKYKGHGITQDEIAKLLAYFNLEGHTGGEGKGGKRYNVATKVIQIGKGKDRKQMRGYLKVDLLAAAAAANLKI